jgi:hypothetical protein
MLDVTLFRWCSAQRVRIPVAGSALADTVASGRAERMASGSCWLRREVAQIHAL